MGWIAIFVIMYLIATGVIAVMQHSKTKEMKHQNKSRSYYGRGEVKTDQEIENEVREKMRTVKVIVYSAITAIVVFTTLLSSIFITDEQQVAFVTTFGKPTVVEGAGVHFKLPYFSKKYKFDATTKGMAIGYSEKDNESVTAESLMITSDFNFVNTDFYVEYRITDPVEYKFGSDDPEGILRNIAQASIRNTVGLYTVDEVITTGKAEIQAIVKEQIIQKLQQHNTGLSIVNVTIQDAEPPTDEVSAAFKAVETAKQDAETAVNNAKKSEKEKIPGAEAEADKIIKAAEAGKTERINQAMQEVAEFKALYAEYLENPDTVKLQLYYSMMEDILPEMEIIIGSDSKVIYVKNGQITAD